MKNMKKLCVALAMLMLFGMSNMSNSYAMEERNAGIELRATKHIDVTDTKWTTVAESNRGLNTNVRITARAALTYTSIRMLDRNGNVVWSQNNVFDIIGDSKVFWCGPDVYKVQLINATGHRSAYATW